MRSFIFILMSMFLLFSCGQNVEKKKNNEIGEAKENRAKETNEGMRLVTGTGKEFIVQVKSSGASMNDIFVIPKGFENTKDTFKLKDADPVENIFLADLNGDGYDELYVITVAAGSGSYATIYVWSSNKDKSVTPVYVRELPEKEQEEVFKGYMGHDSVYVAGNCLYRKFPVYKEGDASCCPSGGTKTIKYALKKGEASWLLEIEKN
ncbi:MAG: hypothetical protein GXO47_07985 [Chlorobi bacterium]|nr:hypothetical protein [Chlorobiota bacterium]